MDSPVLVTIDLQRDFYHPNGSYGQHDRPLQPIQDVVRNLVPVVESHPSVLRIQSIYQPGQFEDMPRLCLAESDGTTWHPDLSKGPLLTKNQHSGFRTLNDFFDTLTPVVLAGVCTHRCIKATLDDLIGRGWTAKILKGGVASCGLRQPKHRKWIEQWEQRNLTTQPSELLNETKGTPSREVSQPEFNDHSSNLQSYSRRQI